MKINIIGPSGTGKTTLAKYLSGRHDIKYHSLDYILYKIIKENGKRSKRMEPSPEEYKREVGDIFKQKGWVVEGRYVIEEIIKEADTVILIKLNPLLSISRQWKRYFTDEAQRKNHGFVNNLRLSISIIKQFYGKEDLSRDKDLKYFRLSKAFRMLEKYKNKVRVINNQKQLSEFKDGLL